jgi:hypothetical protein
MPDADSWWSNMIARMARSLADTRSLEQRRGAVVSDRMDMIDGREPLFVAGQNDGYGGSAEEGKAWQDAQAQDAQAQAKLLEAQRNEEARLSAFDRANADPSKWDGKVGQDGSVVFNDIRAREADTDNGRMLRERLAAEVEARRRRLGRQ